MLKTLKATKLQKNQLIKDIKNAPVKERMQGMPIIAGEITKEAEEICPTGALVAGPLKTGKDEPFGTLDLGKCIFCGECERVCPSIKFTNNYKTGTNRKGALVIPNDLTPIVVRQRIKNAFGHSLKLRQVSAGGCNACEMELNAASNANFDIGRFGIEFVASPRHSDGIVITGPITKNMSYALRETFRAIADPKIVILTGACAISGGIFQNSEEIDRDFIDNHKIDLFVPGCPPHPLTFINAILDFLDK